MHSDALLASIRPFPGCTFSPSRIAGAFASPPAPRWGGTSASGAPRCAPAPGIAMILPVVKNPGPLPEWCLLELQGELELGPEQRARAAAESLEVGAGRLGPRGAKGVAPATLVIGRHELKGGTAPLSRPLLVLERVEGPGGPQLVARAVLREKLAFLKAPRVLVTPPNA